jgi:hypothetical protein
MTDSSQQVQRTYSAPLSIVVSGNTESFARHQVAQTIKAALQHALLCCITDKLLGTLGEVDVDLHEVVASMPELVVEVHI